MRKLFLAATCLIFASASFASNKEDALKGLQVARQQLHAYAERGLVLPAKEMLKLIDAAVAHGLTNTVQVPVGFSYRLPNGEIRAGGEFGGMSSGWRPAGDVPQTREALYFSATTVENGNSWVHVHVRFAKPFEFFGTLSREFNVTLMILVTQGNANLKVNLGDESPDHTLETKRDEDGKSHTWRHENQRLFRYSLDKNAKQPASWTESSYEIKSAGVSMLISRS